MLKFADDIHQSYCASGKTMISTPFLIALYFFQALQFIITAYPHQLRTIKRAGKGRQ